MNALLDSLLDRQKQSWLEGRRPSVDDLLADSDLRSNDEAVLDLLYNEIVVRDELGETPTSEEYVRRYPHLSGEIEPLFEVHRIVGDRALMQTDRLSAAPTQPALDSIPTSPTMCGEYQLLHPIGQGGMGIVYKARHARLRRLAAVKMFHPGRPPSPREQARFQKEAEAIARLQHPHIVQIFEVGDCGGLPFLALELVEGGTLSQRLQKLPLAPKDAAELIEALAYAVQHAHDLGIVHRDIKPANVLFTSDGTPKLTDFGLAKVSDDGEAGHDATRSGEALGTPRYMSPEQAAGRLDLIGNGTDVYALGTLLYECLTGQVPFLSVGVVETLDRIRHAHDAGNRAYLETSPRSVLIACTKSHADDMRAPALWRKT